MLTDAQIEALELGINAIDTRTRLEIESAINWINTNTTLELDPDNPDTFPAEAKLFIIAYADLNSLRVGVVSESIEGLSQTFKDVNKAQSLWDLAEQYLSSYLKNGNVEFIPAISRWES